MYTKRSIQKRVQDFYNNQYCPNDNDDNDDNCIEDYTHQCALQWQQGKPIINTEYIHKNHNNNQYTLDRFLYHNNRCGIRDKKQWKQKNKKNNKLYPWKPRFQTEWNTLHTPPHHTLKSGEPSIDQYIPTQMKVINPNKTTSFLMQPTKAMASLIHILVIPNPSHIKLYNGLSLQKEHIPFVNTMMKVGLAIAKKQRETLFNINTITHWHNNNNNNNLPLQQWLQRDSAIPYQQHHSHKPIEKTIEGKTFVSTLKTCKTWTESFNDQQKHITGMDLTPEKASTLASSIEEKGTLPKPQWHIGFHLHPDHTVGLLHMHIVDTTLMTRTGAEEHFHKTAQWKDLKKVIKKHNH